LEEVIFFFLMLIKLFTPSWLSRRTALTPRRMHRGLKAGKIAKKSALRAEEMFKTEPTFNGPPLAHLPIRHPMQAKGPTPSQSEKILQWVSELAFPQFCRMLISVLTQANTMSLNHPYVSKENRSEAGKARLRISVAARQGVSDCSRYSEQYQMIKSIADDIDIMDTDD
jgi:hypothetical protein